MGEGIAVTAVVRARIVVARVVVNCILVIGLIAE
jgi:hypothetical protein